MTFMSEFFPPLLGGVLIGCSALLLLLAIGRIAGISGIASNLLVAKPAGGKSWRIVFLVGMILGAFILHGADPKVLPFREALPTVFVLVAGLLVGFGASIGGGCTSGHGVCGMGRFSTRSIVATLTFMATAAITVFVIRHIIG